MNFLRNLRTSALAVALPVVAAQAGEEVAQRRPTLFQKKAIVVLGDLREHWLQNGHDYIGAVEGLVKEKGLDKDGDGRIDVSAGMEYKDEVAKRARALSYDDVVGAGVAESAFGELLFAQKMAHGDYRKVMRMFVNGNNLDSDKDGKVTPAELSGYERELTARQK
jgi:hypothetical protein